MKEYSSDKIRNVAVVSHDGAGKTALVESLLLTSGAVDFVGKGQDNKHIMDFEPEEIKRNVTIQLGMAPCEWHDHKVNFVDTPGYNEFHGEVRAALRACDGMLMVLSATSGVETDTVRAWDYAVELQMPRMAFINKMDVDGADFFGTIERMRELFGKGIMPLQIPIGEGANFEGVVDVAKMTAFTYKDGQPTEIAVPAHLIEKAQEIREMTVEAAAEGSDELLEKYLEGEELSLEEIRQGLREGMISGRVCPIMCGSATSRIGLDQVLDRMIRYMPDATKKVMTATDAETGEQCVVHVDKPLTAFVFKTLLDPFAGKQSFVRIFSGELKEGDRLYDVNQGVEEKWGKMVTLIGKQQIPVSSAKAGDIVVIPKLANAKTGDTLTAPDFKVTYDAIRFPQPLYTVALELFSHGIVDLKTRAEIEAMYWSVCREINTLAKNMKHIPEELRNLDKLLADKYFCNFSLFQSLPDSWAIDQLFPIMPIQRLTERPTRNATLQDITCDSDGKIANFVTDGHVGHTLPLHPLKKNEPYYLGVFLVGAYQEILGDMHNLFGDTNAAHISVKDGKYNIDQIFDGETVEEVLDYVQYNPKKLVRQLEQWVTKSVKQGKISLEEGKEFLNNYRSGLYGYTYLE